MEKVQVLIVEDDAIIAMDLESRMKKLGYGVTGVVAYGEKVIEKVKENEPDVVLMDIILKGEMDGIEAAKEMRIQFDIPVIFLTAFADKDRLKRAKLAYPFGFIIKPFQDKDLEITIEMALYIAEVDAERKHSEEALRESEERYRTIFNTVPVSIIMIDKDGQMVDINPYHVTQLGKGQTSKEDYVGVNLITHPSIVNAGLSETYRKVLEGEPFDQKDVYFPTTTGGTDGYLSVKGAPLFKDGKVIGAVTTHEDVAERKQIEETLRESEEKYRLLVETMNEGVGSVDENGVFTFVNDQYSKILGYPPDEIVGKHWTDIFDKNAQNIIKGQLKKRKEGASDRYEVKYTRKDGKKLILNISPRSILTPDGEIKGSMGIISDITESKQTEEALREGEKKSSV